MFKTGDKVRRKKEWQGREYNWNHGDKVLTVCRCESDHVEFADYIPSFITWIPNRFELVMEDGPLASPLTLQSWQRVVHENEKDKGWLEGEYNIPEKLALVHSEVSEALEAYRNGEMHLYYHNSGKPDGFGIELADAVIRLLGIAEHCGIDLESMCRIKHEYNKTRPRRHGGKVC
jgi:hypothetical protein